MKATSLTHIASCFIDALKATFIADLLMGRIAMLTSSRAYQQKSSCRACRNLEVRHHRTCSVPQHSWTEHTAKSRGQHQQL